jgi:hypothetical protein
MEPASAIHIAWVRCTCTLRALSVSELIARGCLGGTLAGVETVPVRHVCWWHHDDESRNNQENQRVLCAQHLCPSRTHERLAAVLQRCLPLESVIVVSPLALPHRGACIRYPNNYWGWGGEDDALGRRLKACGIQIVRPGPECDGAITDLEEVVKAEVGV